MKCESCGANRKRLYTCLACKKKACGCCLYKSEVAGGRVHDGWCHQEAMRAAKIRNVALVNKAIDTILEDVKR